jgi:hypothetical protein
MSKKTRLKRLEQAAIEKWHREWDEFIDKLHAYIPWKAQLIWDKVDDMLAVWQTLPQEQLDGIEHEAKEERQRLFTLLGLDGATWEKWSNTIEEMVSPDFDKPDLQLTPASIPQPPHDPNAALVKMQTLDYSEDVNGWTRFFLLFSLAVAEIVWKLHPQNPIPHEG